MAITIHQIAKQSGVSIGTVSKVLNNREGVSDAVRIKVLKTAERLGYFPYIKARASGLFREKGKYIAEIFGHATYHLINEINYGISKIITRSKFYEIKYIFDETETSGENRLKLFLEHLLRDKGISGLIVSFLALDDKLINDLLKNNIYLVLINSKNDETSYVTVDNFKASYLATEYLIKTGCKHIGLIIPETRNVPVWQDRKEGFKKALLDYNLTYSTDLIEYENTFDIQQIKLATEELLKRNNNIDAIIYSSDWQAYAGIQLLKEKGIKIPDDISVIGFDNLEFSSLIEPSLTSVKQPMEEMGKIAANILLKMIKEKKRIKEKKILNTEIVVRNSTRRI